MSDGEPDIVAREVLLARRIGRLFRYERTAAGTAPPERMNRLRVRRGTLIDGLVRADALRRELRLPITSRLRDAMRALWRDIDAARRDADERLDGLMTELRLARGEGIGSGIRGSAGGRVLGRG